MAEITQSGYDLASRLAAPEDIKEEKGRKAKVVIKPGEEHVDEQEDEEPAIAKESLGFTPYFFWAKHASWFQAILALVSVVLVVRPKLPSKASFQGIILLGGLIRIGLQALLRAWADANGEKQGQWIGAYGGLSAALLLAK